MPSKEVFRYIYRTNFWGGKESRSGAGSGLVQTAVIRRELPRLVQALGVKTLLDAPCGDYYWMRHVELRGVRYVGADIVDECIAANRRHENETTSFLCLDVVSDPLPASDMILCRDGLVHMSYDHALQAVRNFKKTGAKYLLATTFTKHLNSDIGDRTWRPLNLEQPPFSFGRPLMVFAEEVIEAKTDEFDDYRLGLWRLDDIGVGT